MEGVGTKPRPLRWGCMGGGGPFRGRQWRPMGDVSGGLHVTAQRESCGVAGSELVGGVDLTEMKLIL